jgi:hypothetical protein
LYFIALHSRVLYPTVLHCIAVYLRPSGHVCVARGTSDVTYISSSAQIVIAKKIPLVDSVEDGVAS